MSVLTSAVLGVSELAGAGDAVYVRLALDVQEVLELVHDELAEREEAGGHEQLVHGGVRNLQWQRVRQHQHREQLDAAPLVQPVHETLARCLCRILEHLSHRLVQRRTLRLLSTTLAA